MPLTVLALVLILAPQLSALFDEPLWSLIFTALLAIAAMIALLKLPLQTRFGLPIVGVFAVPALALLSLLFQWIIINRGAPVYLDVMVRGLTFWVAAAAAFTVASSNRSRQSIYIVALAIIGGASIRAGVGLQDYLVHLRGHEANWREFAGFSSPDFFAGLMVMTAPVALALFLGSKSGKGNIFWLPYLVATVLQYAVIPTTGSRFALISLAISTAVLAIGTWVSIRSGLIIHKAALSRLAAIVIAIVLGGLVIAKPIMVRLQTKALQSDAHSGDFRVWTWKGTIKLIDTVPVLGSGPGTFVYAYPKHATTGYTNHAHSAYLQTASDIGIPALFLLLSSFFSVLVTSLARLKISHQAQPQSTEHVTKRKKGKQKLAVEESEKSIFEQISAVDDRFLIIGLVGGLSAALVQNLIDSDWFTFATGITLFALAGALSSQGPEPQNIPASSWLKYAAAAIFAMAALLTIRLATGEDDEQQGNYVAAATVNPLSSPYQTQLAMQVYRTEGDFSDTLKALTNAAQLAPDSVTYHRLGTFYLSANEPDKALNSFQSGLIYEPNSVEDLLSAAQLAQKLGESGLALGYYQRIAALELSPYGKVRAIPEVSETRFADADAAIGDSLMARNLPNQAASYYIRAQNDCEEYSQDGGAAQPMRAAMNHGVVDSDLDTHMRALYVSVMTQLALAYEDEGNSGEAEATKAHLSDELKSFPGG